MKKALSFVMSIIDSTCEYTGKFFGLYLILFLVSIIVVEVVARYGFRQPIPGVHDMMTAYFGAYYMMAGAYTYLADEHVRVDVLYAHFSDRGKAILDIVTFPIFLGFIGVLVYVGWGFAMDATWKSTAGWILEFDHSFLRFPLYPLKWTIPIGGFLLLLEGFARFARNIHLLATKKVWA